MATDSHDHPHPSVRSAADIIDRVCEDVGADLWECDRCGGDMVVRSTQVSDEPVRNDIRLKCPSDDGCGWWVSHGIGAPYFDRETFEEEMEIRREVASDTVSQGSASHVDAVNTPAPDSDVEERLDALGYMEM